MKRNKRKKTPRGRTIIKKLQGNTVLLSGGGRYRVGEQVRFSGRGITPIKRKGKVGKVGYSIDDVSDIMDYKPEVGVEVGHGVGFGVGFEVGDWKTYTYDPAACAAVEPVAPAPSAWTSWWGLLCQYGRELREAFSCVAGTPAAVAPAVEPGTPADVAPVPAIVSASPFPELSPAQVSAALPAKVKRKPRRRKN
jgi:hypothetical protein